MNIGCGKKRPKEEGGEDANQDAVVPCSQEENNRDAGETSTPDKDAEGTRKVGKRRKEEGEHQRPKKRENADKDSGTANGGGIGRCVVCTSNATSRRNSMTSRHSRCSLTGFPTMDSRLNILPT